MYPNYVKCRFYMKKSEVYFNIKYEINSKQIKFLFKEIISTYNFKINAYP